MIAEIRVPIDEAFKVLHSGQPYRGPLPAIQTDHPL